MSLLEAVQYFDRRSVLYDILCIIKITANRKENAMKKYTLAAIVAALLAAQGVMAQPPQEEKAPPSRDETAPPSGCPMGQRSMMDGKMKGPMMQCCGAGMRGGAGMGLLMRISHDQELQKQANITEDEAAKLKLMASELQKQMIDHKAALEKAQLDLQTALNMPEPSRDAVMTAADAVAAAQAALMKANLDVKFKVIDLIGADKADALQKACSERRMDLRKKEGRDGRKFWKSKKDHKGNGPKAECRRGDDRDDDDDDDNDEENDD